MASTGSERGTWRRGTWKVCGRSAQGLVGGQADVKRGQLRARPTGNVAFCWIRARVIIDKSGRSTAPPPRASRADATLLLRELQREKVWSRIHLVPLLLAEGDRDAYRRQQAALEREKAIMKDVPGWEVSGHSNGKMSGCSCSLAARHSGGLPHTRTCRICTWDGGRRGKASTTTPATGLGPIPSWLYDHGSLFPLYYRRLISSSNRNQRVMCTCSSSSSFSSSARPRDE